MNLKNRMASIIFMLECCVVICGQTSKSYSPKALGNNVWDIYSDTWVATDALGRDMPTNEEVGDVKTDKQRTVGIFYVTWHSDKLATSVSSPYKGDVTKVLEKDTSARLDGNNPIWTEPSYHWGEPELGYFLSRDEYVIRKDMSMLADAGVDVLIMDVTNGVHYWDEWKTVFDTMQRMKAEGNRVPQFCFWAFNGAVVSVVQDIYDRIYKQLKYKDLWFYWNGKPLLLYNENPSRDASGDNHMSADYSQEVKDFFTLRTMWWGNYEWGGQRFVGTENHWSFGYELADERVRNLPVSELASRHCGEFEQMAVTPAQHPTTLIGKSWTRKKGEPPLNEYDMPSPTYVPWLKDTVDNPSDYGIYFQERWDEALAIDPQFIYLNDWNEWTAGKYVGGKGPGSENPGPDMFMGRKSNFYFVDQYNAEFNRTIQPMKGGYTDNYYMQMAQNIRRYKGVRPLPIHNGFNSIRIDGRFDDWSDVIIEYRDTRGDITHRDYPGYGGSYYVDRSGRNDIVRSKVAIDKRTIGFYVETSDVITPYTDLNWMMLFIDADNDSSTGWCGYDFIINRNVKDDNITTLMKYDCGSKEWYEISRLEYRVSGNCMELAVPRRLLELADDAFIFDFKWADNPSLDLNDPISFTKGDAAPNRRFNYRVIFNRAY